jgi:hypothetical protein
MAGRICRIYTSAVRAIAWGARNECTCLSPLLLDYSGPYRLPRCGSTDRRRNPVQMECES